MKAIVIEEILDAVKEGVLENKHLNNASFAEWRDSAHIIDTYCIDDEGRPVMLSSESNSFLKKEVGQWLLIQQRLENEEKTL